MLTKVNTDTPSNIIK